ncbi:hypothetical protein P3T23_004418 [Paraburkholderia sp. GAS448]
MRKLASLCLLFGVTVCAHADEGTFNLCMARAQAIESVSEIRDKGISQHEYEIQYAKFLGRPLTAVENEVVLLAYAAPDYPPRKLYRLAASGCQKFLP